MDRMAGAGNHSHWEGRDSRNHGAYKGGSLVESTSPRSQLESLAQTIIGEWMASEEGPTRLTSGLRTHMFTCTHTPQTFSHEHTHTFKDRFTPNGTQTRCSTLIQGVTYKFL